MSRPALPCSQRTASGEPCKAFAVLGSDRCSAHLGRVGRKTLLSPALRDELLRMLRTGNYLVVACRAVGISRQTFDDWMQRAKSGATRDAPYRDLAREVERARAEGEVRNVATIAKAAREGDWRAALAMLEREYPERWGPVSVRSRDSDVPTPQVNVEPDRSDPFAEVDELADRRRRSPSSA